MWKRDCEVRETSKGSRFVSIPHSRCVNRTRTVQEREGFRQYVVGMDTIEC